MSTVGSTSVWLANTRVSRLLLLLVFSGPADVHRWHVHFSLQADPIREPDLMMALLAPT